MTNCGASSESCCTTLEVTGGTYFRTYSSDADGGATGLADPATISSFRLDKYLVTVGRFRQFVAAWNGGAGWLPPAGSGKHTHLNGGNGLNAATSTATAGSSFGGQLSGTVSASAGSAYEPGWVASDDSNIGPTNTTLRRCSTQDSWTAAPGPNENLPIDCVNWYEAYAFCIWDGGFLPSAAEWEYATVGGSQERLYPWGSTDPGSANQYAIYDCFYPSGGEGGLASCGDATIAPVGSASLGAGLWGQLDLAGNLQEWALDYSYDFGFPDPCTDCALLLPLEGGCTGCGLAETCDCAFRFLGGGSFDGPASGLSTSSFAAMWAMNESLGGESGERDFNDGFRCARAP
jgi:formylglycine-generating enzyme required for sulfatase activity